MYIYVYIYIYIYLYITPPPSGEVPDATNTRAGAWWATSGRAQGLARAGHQGGTRNGYLAQSPDGRPRVSPVPFQEPNGPHPRFY